MPAQPLVIVREQQEPAGRVARNQDHQQRREDALDPAGVEAREAEVAVGKPGLDDAGDQESGDDEEDVNADEAAGQHRWPGMKYDHRQHRDRAQSINVRPITGASRGGAGRESRAHSDAREVMAKIAKAIHAQAMKANITPSTRRSPVPRPRSAARGAIATTAAPISNTGSNTNE